MNPNFVLIAAMMGLMLVGIDISVMNVAVEAIRDSFQIGLNGVEWVLNIYTLAYATLLLNAGALSDRFGPRFTFMAGFALFTAASLACGLAPSFSKLLLARLVQGIGAALLIPSALSLLRIAYPDDALRAWAIGLWSGMGSVALAAGPVIGGSLISLFGWRSIFLINIPIGIAGLWMTWRHAPRHQKRTGQKLDLPGLAAAALSLALVTGSITQASEYGFGNAWILSGLASGLVGLAAFLTIEARSRQPMMPLPMFRNPVFSLTLAIGFVVNFAFYGLVFILSLYFQSVQGRSAFETGLTFVPMTAVTIVVNLAAGRLYRTWGLRNTLIVGMLASSLGYVLLIGLDHDTFYASMIPGFVLAGTGVALTVPALTAAALHSVTSERAGIASGIFNAVRQVGGAIGVAVFGAILGIFGAEHFTVSLTPILALASVALAAGAITVSLTDFSSRV